MEGGPERTVHMALDAGARPEIFGGTHLRFLTAINRGHETIVRRLFELGVELNTTSGYSGFLMPLSQAVIYGRMGITRFFLSSGADVNLTDGSSQTPLSCAISRGDENMVRLLLENGAYANAPGIFACSKPFLFLDPRPPLHDAAETKYPNIVRLLLERGADPATRCKKGLIPLHLAVKGYYCTNVQIMKDLLAVSDVNCQESCDRMTALHFAVKCRDGKAVPLLLQAKGIDVNIRNWKDQTPLCLAAEIGDSGLVATILTRPDIALDIPDRYGMTPLVVAELNRYWRTAKLLKKEERSRK